MFSTSDISRPDTYWLKRWCSLRHSISMSQLLANDKGFTEIECFLKQLKIFAELQFYYFYCGFSDKKNLRNLCFDNKYKHFKEQDLVVDYAYPPDYVLRVIIDQISHDYDVIHRALTQRLYSEETYSVNLANDRPCEEAEALNANNANNITKPRSKDPGESEETVQQIKILGHKGTLELADDWASLLLCRVKHAFKKKDNGEPILPNVISYFNRSAQIRLIPYANTALIGVPITAAMTAKPRDLLAIPHEIGHYVFWHGTVDERRIRDILRDIVQGEMPYLQNWIEEIFSDVFGLIVGGEVVMLPWIISMIKDNQPSLSVTDTGIHPINAIRPYIYLNTIKALHKSINNELLKKEMINSIPIPPDLREKLEMAIPSSFIDTRSQMETETQKKQKKKNSNLSSTESLNKKTKFSTEGEIEQFWKYFEDYIQEMNRIAGGFEGFKTKNNLGEIDIISLEKLNASLNQVILKIIELIIDKIYVLGKSQRWEERFIPLVTQLKKDMNYFIIIDRFKPGFLEILGDELFKTSSIPTLPDDTTDNDPYRPYRARAMAKTVNTWWDEFDKEKLLSKKINSDTNKDIPDPDCDPDPDCKEENILKRAFMVIRDNPKFGKTIDPSIWKIVFAADGWTVKGPEGRPTGDVEDGLTQHSSFHL